MPELTETPHDLLIEANPELAAKYSSALAWLRHLETRRHRQAGGLVMQEVNAHVRLAMPWVCLVVAMISVPAGVRSGRRGAMAAVGVAFLLVLVFYIVMQMSMILGKKTLLMPWVSAWLPNALFFIVGAIGISRME
jgi:lipopolysaccharide export LptBFGC system permease protein LptF